MGRCSTRSAAPPTRSSWWEWPAGGSARQRRATGQPRRARPRAGRGLLRARARRAVELLRAAAEPLRAQLVLRRRSVDLPRPPRPLAVPVLARGRRLRPARRGAVAAARRRLRPRRPRLGRLAVAGPPVKEVPAHTSTSISRGTARLSRALGPRRLKPLGSSKPPGLFRLLGPLRLLKALALLAVALVSWGHVGSPNVFFEGAAGPYPVHVVVRPPAVIPGVAEIAVRVRAPVTAAGSSAPPAASGRRGLGKLRVTAQPVQWDAGPEGAPPADVAQPVRGAPGLFAARLWMMTANSYRSEEHTSE